MAITDEEAKVRAERRSEARGVPAEKGSWKGRGLLKVRDVPLNVEVRGRGYPLAHMHGGPSADLYTMLPFRQLADQFTLISYDHRCNGRSVGVPVSSMTWENLTADADALRERLGFERWAVLGHSFGGHGGPGVRAALSRQAVTPRPARYGRRQPLPRARSGSSRSPGPRSWRASRPGSASNRPRRSPSQASPRSRHSETWRSSGRGSAPW